MQNTALLPDETGNIPSPFPYLNADSDEWKGDDERGGLDFGGGSAMVRTTPKPPQGGGGLYAEIDFMLSPFMEDLLPTFA